MSGCFRKQYRGVNLLLTTANDKHIRLNFVVILCSLRLPTDGSGLVTVRGFKLGELKERLGNGVNGPQTPALGGEDCIDHCVGVDELGVEGEAELEVREVWVGTLDLGQGGDELKVGGLDGREKIGGRTANVLTEVESSIVPSKGEFVTPHT